MPFAELPVAGARAAWPRVRVPRRVAVAARDPDDDRDRYEHGDGAGQDGDHDPPAGSRARDRSPRRRLLLPQVRLVISPGKCGRAVLARGVGTVTGRRW
ncbi:hypothetical protein FRACA_330009 [Frankia canadensis]|uniref:Uncharacterized protein n=1 Tax=Frankia canadensis TaxID=1836972 RepID=A0A2I2KUR0_9ACTN|nr:hypothetical protein FRACA_330009 [Frankia canadensis]SOU56696.1 hypothetical protein FRACA_330009 [Frankia canadensis]